MNFRSSKEILLIVFVFTLGNSTDAFIIFRLQRAGITIAYIPLLWAGLHLVQNTILLLSGWLSDHIPLKKLVGMGWLIYGLCYLAFGFLENRSLIIATLGIYGLYFGFTEGPERAFDRAHQSKGDLRKRLWILCHGDRNRSTPGELAIWSVME